MGEPARRHRPQRVGVAPGALSRAEPLLAGDAERDRTPLGDEDRREGLVVLAGPQVAAAAEDVMELVGVPRLARELPLHLLDGVAVEQVAQLLLPEQLAQEV